MLDFLTPELFDLLIIANLGVGLLLIIWRFIVDMRHTPHHGGVPPSARLGLENDDDTYPNQPE